MLKEGRFYSCGRSNGSLPVSPELIVHDDGKTISVKTDIKCDIEFITVKHNYYQVDNYATIEKSVKSACYTLGSKDRYLRIKATHYHDCGTSQSWNNPIYFASFE